MTTDLPPLTAFALEGSGAAALAMGSDHTLTLQQEGRGSRGRALATAKVGVPAEGKSSPLRAAVVPAASAGLTLTF